MSAANPHTPMLPLETRLLVAADAQACPVTAALLREAAQAGLQTQQHEAHRLAYPGGGAALFEKLWHLTFNCVTAHAGNLVRTDLLPMQEMREFLEHLCCIVDSPPAQQPDGMRIATVELENPMPTFDEVFDEIDWDAWRMQPIRELVRMIHGKTSSRQEQDALRIAELESELALSGKQINAMQKNERKLIDDLFKMKTEQIAAVQAEREACAQIVFQHTGIPPDALRRGTGVRDRIVVLGEHIMSAIRARGQQ